MRRQSVQCANFTTFVGQSFMFQTLDLNRMAIGPILAGTLKSLHRAGRQMVVDIYIPAKHCTHTYYAKDVYYRGAITTCKAKDDAAALASGTNTETPRTDGFVPTKTANVTPIGRNTTIPAKNGRAEVMTIEQIVDALMKRGDTPEEIAERLGLELDETDGK